MPSKTAPPNGKTTLGSKERLSDLGASSALQIGKERVGYAPVTRRRHDKRLGQHGTHDWWYRCLATAGVIPDGVTSGANMHRGRHTAITDLVRGSGNLKLAQQLAGHADIKTTARYAQLNTTDLADALRALSEAEE